MKIRKPAISWQPWSPRSKSRPCGARASVRFISTRSIAPISFTRYAGCLAWALIRPKPPEIVRPRIAHAHEGSKGSDDEAGPDAESLLLDGDNEKSRETKQ